MTATIQGGFQRLNINEPIWERVFTAAPLVLIGSLGAAGVPILAPKHMALPLGWENYFGFICTPTHKTWCNIVATKIFTVSYPRPDQLLYASLAASPRCDDDSKPIVSMLDTIEAPESGAPLLSNAYLWLEWGFGCNGLIAGRIVGAYAADDAVCHSGVEADTRVRAAPLFVYVHPGQFAVIDSTHFFPFPAGMKK